MLFRSPASNTLSWRWVGGLQTRGKSYLARASNIVEYTNGRFRVDGLAREAEPLEWDNPPSASPLAYRAAPSGAPSLLLVTEEDCSPEVANAVGFLTWQLTAERSQLPVSDIAQKFAAGALADASARLLKSMSGHGAFEGRDSIGAIIETAKTLGVTEIVTMYAPVGPVADALNELEQAAKPHGIALKVIVREWDRLAWPYASRGFFNLKEHIPELLRLNHLL